MVLDNNWLEEQVNSYSTKEYPVYRLYSEFLDVVFQGACVKNEILGIVNSRAKSIPSFAEKLIRKSSSYDDPGSQVTDLCGARVITNTQDETERIISFIRENFRVDEENSYDLRSMLKAEEFGYRSVHYIVQLKPDGPDISEIVKEFRDRNGGIDVFETVGDRRAEIQVRTLLQHAWAMISHDRFYKSNFEIPEYFRRELARVAALLESADEEFGNAINGIDEYRFNYGAYLSRDQIRKEVEKWKMVLSYDPDNVQLAHRIGQLAIAMEDWDQAIAILEPFRDSGKGFVRRDLGIALIRAGQDGRDDLDAAAYLDPDDAGAWWGLGESWRSVNDQKALKNYERAFHLTPSDPRTLGSYLEARLRLSKDIDFVPLMAPTLEAAIATCQKLADAHVYLPDAFFDIARFSILLNRPFECLNALTKAVTLCDTILPIMNALDSIRVMTGPIQNSAVYNPEYEELFWAVDAVERYLGLSIVVKRLKCRDRDDHPTNGSVSSQKDCGDPELSESEVTMAIEKYLRDLVISKLSPDQGPFMIVAGGCSSNVQEEMEEYREPMRTAFECYTGTIISGASNAGISGIVGDLDQCTGGEVRKIGYIPGTPPPDFEGHPSFVSFPSHRLSHVSHDIVGPRAFTPLEPIQSWIDLLAGGVRPGDVRVLGINGGAISGFEYRMALSFGATVGIVKSSGRSAAELQTDSEWWNAPDLLWLPKDGNAIRAFVNPGGISLDEDHAERLGQVIHERFLMENRYKNLDPAMMPWDELRDDLKRSNLNQANYAEKILRAVGWEVREMSNGGDGIEGEDQWAPPAFSDDEVERMAELEHGRWIVERLKSGWTYGPERDSQKRTSPYLIPWNDLPDEIRDFDRIAVGEIPECLKEAGLEVYRIE
jgi:ppGpp synthetase/RelA/SpoT-type nucleotidyltranferase